MAQSDRTAYAVTDSIKNGVRWNFLRTLDLNTGAYGNILTRLLGPNDTPAVPNTGLVNGVAAIALDRKNKRVYFTPMLLDRLSYVDLRTMNRVIVRNNFTGLMPKQTDQSNIFTRMVINEDGRGYALTNDGNHLVRFRTNGNNNVTNLGSLVDAQSNGEISVHNSCTSGGGDLIATEDEDILYLITFRNLVFKINLENRVAKYLGTINGLPATFSTSGAAVDQTGKKLILVSSVDASDVYSLNMNSLMATGLRSTNALHAADLGGSGLFKNKKERNDDDDDRLIIVNSETPNEKIQLYPNPVTGNEFKIQFLDAPAGNYTVEVMDVKGQLVTRQLLNTSGKNSVATVNLPLLTARGIFIVRVVDKNNKPVFNEKIVLQ